MNNQIKQYFDKIVGNGRDRSLQRTGFRFTIGALAALATVGIFAVAVDTLTSFTTGTAAKASEVNANFTALKTAVESIPSWVKGTTATDAVYTAGNVGIGTTTPTTIFEIVTSGTLNGFPGVLLKGDLNRERFSIETSKDGVFQSSVYGGSITAKTAVTSGTALGVWRL